MKTKLKLRKEVVATLSSNDPIRGGYPTDAAKPSYYEADCTSAGWGNCSNVVCYSEDGNCVAPNTQNCPIDPQTKVCTGPGPTAQCTCNCATYDCQSVMIVCEISNACAPSQVCA